MTLWQNLSIVSIFVITLIFNYFYFRFTVIKRLKVNKEKFQLYAYRDELIALITTKKFSPGDYLFNELYDLINKSIIYIEQLDFKNFLRILSENSYRRNPQLEKAIRNSDPEVKVLMKRYIETVLHIMVMNGLFFKTVLRIIGIKDRFRILNLLIKFLKVFSHLENQKETYSVYRDYKTYNDRLKLALQH